MINKNFNFILLVLPLIVCGCVISRSKVVIPKVSHVCESPEGHLGQCTSASNCHNELSSDRNASLTPCENGHGSPPYVCCMFGKKIVFPDDYNDDKKPAAAMKTSVLKIEKDMFVAETRAGVILFPNDDGSFDMPSEIAQKLSKRDQEPVNKMDELPKAGQCGPISLRETIHGGREADLTEFPWLVNLEYRTVYNELLIGCAGNIVSHRYILTAAHCVKGSIEVKFGILESLRAGDHNTSSNKDCDELGCIEPFVRYKVMSKIVHDNYHVNDHKKIFYDIALLKTDREIKYTDAVKPVCLPSIMPNLTELKGGARLTVGGWGDNGTADYTEEKRVVDIPYVTNEDCPFNVEPYQLCAGGELGRDSCTGDSGGSLVRRTEQGMIMEGIVSYGRSCGTDQPAIYTRVRSFMGWIEAHMV